MFRLFCLVIGYGIGCIQTAYIVGKLAGKIDIREHGSGNAGTTNMMRTLGLKPGAIVFISDVLKAVVAYFLCTLLFDGDGGIFHGDNSILPGLYAGAGVILGHNFPFYLKFKGGKGVASTLGMILCADWRLALIDFACGLTGVLATKYISFAALIMTGLFPFLLIAFGYELEAIVLGFLIGGLSYYQHRGNIKRLIEGNERKFSFERKKND